LPSRVPTSTPTQPVTLTGFGTTAYSLPTDAPIYGYWANCTNFTGWNQIQTVGSCFVLLINRYDLVPKIFICPSAGDLAMEMSEPVGVNNPGVFKSWADLRDFRTGDQLSYSYNDFWYRLLSTNYPTSLAVMADKSRVFDSDDFTWVNPGTTFPAVGGDYTQIGTPNESTINWTLNNSKNHKEELQNVGYLGGHVRKETTPKVGVGNDNIYTYNDFASKGAKQWMLGTWPTAGIGVGKLCDGLTTTATTCGPRPKQDSVLGN
jgi:hypothetical protein